MDQHIRIPDLEGYLNQDIYRTKRSTLLSPFFPHTYACVCFRARCACLLQYGVSAVCVLRCAAKKILFARSSATPPTRMTVLDSVTTVRPPETRISRTLAARSSFPISTKNLSLPRRPASRWQEVHYCTLRSKSLEAPKHIRYVGTRAPCLAGQAIV